ncbi:MAG: alpha/beta hydrolase family protein [Pseudoalteromonas distincta]|uniref:alpha/beta hydrolase family protein n=1 Tax=Pseudoalteromonas distincta TaxID=77608 RepID=UPI003F9607EA
MLKITLLFFLLTASVVHAKDKPWESYAKLPMVEQPQISPNGEMIATLYNTAEGPTISLAKFPSIEFNILASLKKDKDRVDFIRWSGNKYIIVSASYPEYVNGQYMRVSRLYSINVETNESKMLTTRRFSEYKWYRYQSFRLVSSLKNEPDFALVSTFDEKDKAYSVFKVELGDSSFDKIQRNKENIGSWYADPKGVLRLGIAIDKKNDKFIASIWYRAKKDEALKMIHTHILGEDSTFSIQGLNEDGTKAYVLSDRVLNRQALWSYDIESGEFEELVYSNDKYDINNAIVNSEGDFIGVGYYDDFYKSHYFSEVDGKQELMVANLFGDKQASIVSRSKDRTRILVNVISDSVSPTYYYFDLNTKKGGAWLSKFPYLARNKFVPVQNYSFKASDGAEISGYFTKPEGIKTPPLIVMPHGGPHSRDYKYFNRELQYLVSLGYAVLQVNFRGSEGFGSAFETDGYYQWGKRMQQDVYDAMDWATRTGLTSKNNACIYGASYGGYVALTAAWQEPERFKCIISISGISDLKGLVEDEERQDAYLGNIVDMTDSKAVDALSEVSAINMINRIKAPILLIHGTKDTRVDYRQSKYFYDKAKRNLDIKYVEIDDGTHFFDDPESLKVQYKEVTEFLKKHL